MVQEKGFSPIIFERDSMILSSAIKKQSHFESALGPIYEYIMEGLSTLLGCSFHHAYRQVNTVAYCIARQTLLVKFCSSWESQSLDFLSDVLLKDCNLSS